MVDDEQPTEGPHPTDAEMRKCSVCGYTRRNVPSALKFCCGQPMEIVYEGSILRLNGETMRVYDLTKLSILVLEKDLLILRLLTDVFREFGMPPVQSTHDPEEAWKMYCQPPTDIILSDWTEGLDGMAFLTKIRQDEDSPNPFIPFLVCTANTEYRHVCYARDKGMTDFLAKPVSAHTIYSRICAMVEDDRYFIRITDFFGPDRRRYQNVEYPGNDRRKRLR